MLGRSYYARWKDSTGRKVETHEVSAEKMINRLCSVGAGGISAVSLTRMDHDSGITSEIQVSDLRNDARFEAVGREMPVMH